MCAFVSVYVHNINVGFYLFSMHTCTKDTTYSVAPYTPIKCQSSDILPMIYHHRQPLLLVRPLQLFTLLTMCTQENIMYSYICIASMNVVFSFTLQYNPPLVSYSAKITKDVLQKINKLCCLQLVSHGRKSMLLFKSGKREAVALITSIGFGVTRPSTCWVRQNKGQKCVYSLNVKVKVKLK